VQAKKCGLHFNFSKKTIDLYCYVVINYFLSSRIRQQELEKTFNKVLANKFEM
jgi:hypothetical protein